MLSKAEARKVMLSIPGTDERPWFNQPSVFIHDRFLAKTHHKEDAVTLQVGWRPSRSYSTSQTTIANSLLC
jgi:hypothetical protein